MADELQYPCPCCQGAKVQHVTGTEVTAEGTRQLEPVDIPCVWCDGQGLVGAKGLLQHQAYQALWCRCDHPSGKTVFFNDGEHPDLSKHHYRCYDCKRVTQIG